MATVFLEAVDAVMRNWYFFIFTDVPFWGNGLGCGVWAPSGFLEAVNVMAAVALLPSLAAAVTVAVPSACAVASPLASTDTTAGLLDVKDRDLSFASPGRTTELICTVSPTWSDVFGADSWMLFTSTGRIVREIDPDIPLPSFAMAVMIAVPSAFAVTKPFSFTVATVVSEDVQVSDLSCASSGRTLAFRSRVSPMVNAVLSEVTWIPSTNLGGTVSLISAALEKTCSVSPERAETVENLTYFALFASSKAAIFQDESAAHVPSAASS